MESALIHLFTAYTTIMIILIVTAVSSVIVYYKVYSPSIGELTILIKYFVI